MEKIEGMRKRVEKLSRIGVKQKKMSVMKGRLGRALISMIK